jgi:coproporphyrinogen III oxidase-like Fe-S oxidoreductase
VQKTDADLGSAVAEVENLSVQEQMREMMMLGLRMTEEGLSEPAFYHRFGHLPDAIFGVEIEDLLKKGLVAWHPFEDGRHLVMTPKAYLLGNLVFRAFV